MNNRSFDFASVERGRLWADSQPALFADGDSPIPETPDAGAALEARALARLNGGHSRKQAKKPASRKDGVSFGGGAFVVRDKGVCFIEGEEADEKESWLCSRLDVVAETRDAKGNAWGRLLRWRDHDGRQHEWAMPLELLGGDGSDVRRELLRQGVRVAPGRKARELLTAYLQVWRCDKRARCVERIGWSGCVYVLPDAVIGDSDEITVFQNPQAIAPAFSQAGTLEAWKDSVARLASGNSRLVFALSVAFAAPLAALADEASGGFHLRGESSTGKTTALKIAASVWGHPGQYPRQWRSTDNGLEGLAALHNDGLLILDELKQCDPRKAGEIAYLLANGQGKARANRIGAAREPWRWRLLFLSSGEQSLAALMAQAGHKPAAGQEIRMADIAADAGAGMGAFETLHKHATPDAFAKALCDAALSNHGTAGMAWLRHLVENREKVTREMLEPMRQFVDSVTPENSGGQISRVARRFALAAFAGEQATDAGLTGWNEGEAAKAAATCFNAWLEGFGGAGNREDRETLAQVKAFFEAHGASRFEWINPDRPDRVERITNRAGFFRSCDDGTREYYVLPEIFRSEVCKGLDMKQAGKALAKAGWLQPSGGRNTQLLRLPGLGTTRVYVFTRRMWEETPC